MTEQTQPTDAELLPCPFCEGRARMKTVASDWWKIVIDHAEGCVLSGHYDDAIVPQDDESKDWLIDRWNTRAKWGTPAGAGEPLFWYRPVCGGDMYEGPFHTNSADAKTLRAYKPDEWKPLFTTPQPTSGEPVGEVQHLHELNDEWLSKLPIGTKLYTTPQPTQAQAGAVPLTDEQCDAIYEALDAFGREVDHYEYGLPYCTSDGETLAKPEAREVIRQAAHGIKGADHA